MHVSWTHRKTDRGFRLSALYVSYIGDPRLFAKALVYYVYINILATIIPACAMQPKEESMDDMVLT